MKSLLDIQKEMHTLEQTVEDVSVALREISNDMEMLRKTANKSTIDFKRIKRLAKQFQFAKHPINRLKDANTCRSYIEILLCIVLLEDGEEERLNRLIFIQWLQTEASIEWTLEQLYTACYQLTKESYTELFETIPKDYKESLLVDALIVAYMNGEANADICEYIADLCEASEIERDTLLFLYQMARIALTQKVERMPREKNKVEKMFPFLHYFDESVRRTIFEKLRRVVVEVSWKQVRYFEWRLNSQGQYVVKGTILAEAEDNFTGKRKKFRATMDGACFYFRQDDVFYAVISHETDQLKWIRSWMKRNKK